MRGREQTLTLTQQGGVKSRGSEPYLRKVCALSVAVPGETGHVCAFLTALPDKSLCLNLIMLNLKR